MLKISLTTKKSKKSVRRSRHNTITHRQNIENIGSPFGPRDEKAKLGILFLATRMIEGWYSNCKTARKDAR